MQNSNSGGVQHILSSYEPFQILKCLDLVSDQEQVKPDPANVVQDSVSLIEKCLFRLSIAVIMNPCHHIQILEGPSNKIVGDVKMDDIYIPSYCSWVFFPGRPTALAPLLYSSLKSSMYLLSLDFEAVTMSLIVPTSGRVVV